VSVCVCVYVCMYVCVCVCASLRACVVRVLGRAERLPRAHVCVHSNAWACTGDRLLAELRESRRHAGEARHAPFAHAGVPAVGGGGAEQQTRGQTRIARDARTHLDLAMRLARPT